MNFLSISATQALLTKGALLIDTRPTPDFVQGFVSKSIHLPLGEKFADNTAVFINPEDPIIVIAAVGQEEHTYRTIVKTGFINMTGIVEG